MGKILEFKSKKERDNEILLENQIIVLTEQIIARCMAISDILSKKPDIKMSKKNYDFLSGIVDLVLEYDKDKK